MTSTESTPQISIYEKVVEDAALEEALEARYAIAEERRELNKRFREADAKAKALLDLVELGLEAPVRVGRFVVSMRPVASREVSFSTDPTSRLQISLIPDTIAGDRSVEG